MEKRSIIWTLLTGIAVSLVIVACSMTYAVRQGNGTAEGAEVSEEQTEAGFVLRIDNGQLALFRQGSSVPYQRLDMPLNLLSEADYEQLEQGISVETEAELRRLVEDYCG